MKPKIGVAILAYEGFSDLVRCVRSVKFNSKLPVQIIVFDNSEKTTMIRDYIQEAHSDVDYISVGRNIGCSESRNMMLAHFLDRVPAGKYLCILDQDIECQKGWLKAMVNVAETNDDCGVVAWPMANRYRKVTNTGIVSEVASLCNLHSVRALLDVQERWGGPWEAQMFMHKFDSLICQRLNMLNWHTYLVLDMYKPHIVWPSQPAKILHHHPHAGVRRNPKWRDIFSKSKRLYAQIQHREGWKEWVPPGPYLTYTGPRRGH